MPPKKGKKIKTSKITLDLSSLTNLVTNINDAIETLNLYTKSFHAISTTEIPVRISLWCKYFYYILDHYEFVKLGRVMREHFHILGNDQLVDMKETTNFFWGYNNYLNSDISSNKSCLFWKGSLEYLNYR
jgi:hypothetical protein